MQKENYKGRFQEIRPISTGCEKAKGFSHFKEHCRLEIESNGGD